MDLDYLSGMGVRLCLQGHQPFMAAVQAVYSTLAALRAGTPPRELPGVAPAELMARLTHAADYEARIDDRSEEHTSELQSLMRSSYAVFCLKKKTKLDNRRSCKTKRQS